MLLPWLRCKTTESTTRTPRTLGIEAFKMRKDLTDNLKPDEPFKFVIADGKAVAIKNSNKGRRHGRAADVGADLRRRRQRAVHAGRPGQLDDRHLRRTGPPDRDPGLAGPPHDEHL